MSSAPTPQSPPPTKLILQVTPIHIYNLPLSEAFLVLDVRGAEAYRAGHALSAWMCGGAAAAGEPTAVLGLLANIWDTNPPEQLSTVVIVADAHQNVEALARFFACTTRAEAEVVMQASSTPCYFGTLFERLQTVSIFAGQMCTFASAFPFLVGGGGGDGADDKLAPVLPAMVLPATGSRGALFIGGQSHASSAEVFALLKIGAVVNATTAGEIPCHFQASGGVQYLRCELHDDVTQPLHEAFAGSHAFIELEGCGTGTATLVHCSRGINRSAALVAHHLVRSGSAASPDAAIALVRYGAFPSLAAPPLPHASNQCSGRSH
jgi:hypothetical protein